MPGISFILDERTGVAPSLDQWSEVDLVHLGCIGRMTQFVESSRSGRCRRLSQTQASPPVRLVETRKLKSPLVMTEGQLLRFLMPPTRDNRGTPPRHPTPVFLPRAVPARDSLGPRSSAGLSTSTTMRLALAHMSWRMPVTCHDTS